MNSFFLRDLQRLRKWCPLLEPVAIYRVRNHHACGTFTWSHKRLIITIHIDDDPRQERETLIHEWAHALSYDATWPEERYNLPTRWIKHSNAWGIAYARCYRAVQIPVTDTLGYGEMNYRL